MVGADGAGQMQHFVNDDGYNTFRLPVGWQFLTNDILGGTINAANFAKYDALVQVLSFYTLFEFDDVEGYPRSRHV